MAYYIEADVFEHLDFRAKNGYRRVDIPIQLAEGGEVSGTVYIAREDNHAFLGPAELVDIARQVADSPGPSGANREYVLHLARSLRELNAIDEHVFALAALLE